MSYFFFFFFPLSKNASNSLNNAPILMCLTPFESPWSPLSAATIEIITNEQLRTWYMNLQVHAPCSNWLFRRQKSWKISFFSLFKIDYNSLNNGPILMCFTPFESSWSLLSAATHRNYYEWAGSNRLHELACSCNRFKLVVQETKNFEKFHFSQIFQNHFSWPFQWLCDHPMSLLSPKC